MEILFDIVLLSLLFISTWLNVVIYKDFIHKKETFFEIPEILINAITTNTEQQIYTSHKIDALGNGLDRSMLSLRELLENAKPIKSNNWDSVREAFKGPARIEINERN